VPERRKTFKMQAGFKESRKKGSPEGDAGARKKTNPPATHSLYKGHQGAKAKERPESPETAKEKSKRKKGPARGRFSKPRNHKRGFL